MTKGIQNPQSTSFTPSYLERYAAEVDDWHRQALARRAARRRIAREDGDL